jgi:hypothetical protein
MGCLYDYAARQAFEAAIVSSSPLWLLCVIGQQHSADLNLSVRIYRTNCSSDRLGTHLSLSPIDNVARDLL